MYILRKKYYSKYNRKNQVIQENWVEICGEL